MILFWWVWEDKRKGSRDAAQRGRWDSDKREIEKESERMVSEWFCTFVFWREKRKEDEIMVDAVK